MDIIEAKNYLLRAESDCFVQNFDNGNFVMVVNWCGGRYACFDIDNELSGISDNLDDCINFLLGKINFVK